MYLLCSDVVKLLFFYSIVRVPCVWGERYFHVGKVVQKWFIFMRIQTQININLLKFIRIHDRNKFASILSFSGLARMRATPVRGNHNFRYEFILFPFTNLASPWFQLIYVWLEGVSEVALSRVTCCITTEMRTLLRSAEKKIKHIFSKDKTRRRGQRSTEHARNFNFNFQFMEKRIAVEILNHWFKLWWWSGCR